MEFGTVHWICGVCAAMLVGFSKTGVPGLGILIVPLMVHVFPGKVSAGALLPLLIFGDFFAVGGDKPVFAFAGEGADELCDASFEDLDDFAGI